MDPYRTACYALIASAFILTGMLVTQVGQYAESTAHADMLAQGNNVSAMTARSLTNEESLFILDNSNDVLMIYSMDFTRRRLELAGGARLSELFNTGGGGNAGGMGGGGMGGGR